MPVLPASNKAAHGKSSDEVMRCLELPSLIPLRQNRALLLCGMILSVLRLPAQPV
jgi:hypothetical protein